MLVWIAVAVVGLVVLLVRRAIGAKSPAWMVFLGSGGHTGEMMRMLAGAAPPRLVVVHGAGDAMSAARAHKLGPAQTLLVPRARAVGQGWLSTAVSSARSLLASVWVVAGANPRLLLVNGPGTCVILAGCVLLLRPFGLQTRIVYVESLARVSTLSLSGRLLYPVADAFVVQWPALAAKYPRARYMGMLV